MTVVDVTYRKAGLDAFLSDQALTMKAEGEIAPGFDLGPDTSRTEMPFDQVFPAMTSGPTTLGAGANAALEADALDGYLPGQSLMMSADGDWLHKDEPAGTPPAPAARFRMVEAPPPSLDNAHGTFSHKNATGDWLGKAQAAMPDQPWPAPRASKSVSRSGF